MAFTIEQVETLEKAIAQGATSVQYADKRVSYRNLDEMVQTLQMMKTELGILKSSSNRKLAQHSKGL